ncbi:VOC family protein [Methylobacterium nodulans]|uniref:3-demethylubiquinone-9 3-methyltransferase n=1 Tax=Methylobacterium nodulans (strain LMG 21967 / CNCM I-2342 / ORS 2060) TaxID=460265 RepID=B8IF59_METNO|nr:VOC family protein [Methylobacterium nodulans]ACL55770.1 3-demethylubiquinone-9 3-methyltransferase [Methylobacterium nodulans ORS 2060]
MQGITPFLWFDGQAEEAARFYVSVFPDGRIERIVRCGEGGPGPAGSVLTVAFTVAGQRFTALNGGPQFPFTEAVSFVVTCDSQAEIDAYWAALSEGGAPGRCGWLKDRYGLSWQIVPAGLPEWLDGSDPARAGRVMAALMTMDKLDAARLAAA